MPRDTVASPTMGFANEKVRHRAFPIPPYTRYGYISRPAGLVGAAEECGCRALFKP
jgi:hypothetical protein